MGDEWAGAFRKSAAPDLVAALAGCETEEILDLLQERWGSLDSDDLDRIAHETEGTVDHLQRRYESADSDELEQMIRQEDRTNLRKFWSWPL